MIIDKVEVGAYGGSAFTTILTIIQTNQIFQIIEMVLAIISFAVSICYTIYKWYSKAKEDGKITKEEVEELVDEIKDDLKDGDKDGDRD